MKLHFIRSGFVASGLAFTVAACGGGGGVGISNLSDLPNASSMLSTSSSTGYSRMAVSGAENAPTLSEFAESDSESLVIEKFWGDLFDGGISSTDEANIFFGRGPEGSYGGEGACQMLQSVAQSLNPLFEATISSCFMKGMAENMTNEIVTPIGDSPVLSDYSDIFDVEGRVLMVETANEDYDNDDIPDEDGGQRIFIQIVANNSSTYTHRLWFCDGKSDSSNVRGVETAEVNKATGAYTMSTKGQRDEGGGRTSTNEVSVVAYLTTSGGEVVFDTARNREILAKYTYDDAERSFDFKGAITVTNSQIIAKTWNKGTDTFESNEYARNDKHYSIAEFSGSGRGIKFLQGAFSGLGQFYNTDDEVPAPFVYEGATEWVDTVYRTLTSGSLYDAVTAYDFSTDNFFASGEEPSAPDISDVTSTYNCQEAQADYKVQMDFNTQVMSNLKDVCEADRFERYDLCWGGNIETARSQAYGQFYTP